MAMLPVILASLAALSATEGPVQPTFQDYLAEVCQTLPAEVCDNLDRFAVFADQLVRIGTLEAGSWCCESCAEEEAVGGGTKIVCTNCLSGGNMMRCGSVRYLSRPVHIDCPGRTSETDGAVTCY